MRTAVGLGLGALALVTVHYVHTGIFKQGWEKGRNKEEGKWTPEEWEEGEEAERKSFGLAPLKQDDVEERRDMSSN